MWTMTSQSIALAIADCVISHNRTETAIINKCVIILFKKVSMPKVCAYACVCVLTNILKGFKMLVR